MRWYGGHLRFAWQLKWLLFVDVFSLTITLTVTQPWPLFSFIHLLTQLCSIHIFYILYCRQDTDTFTAKDNLDSPTNVMCRYLDTPSPVFYHYKWVWSTGLTVFGPCQSKANSTVSLACLLFLWCSVACSAMLHPVIFIMTFPGEKIKRVDR